MLCDSLEKVVQLFSFLQDKDMFNEYYRKALAKRLLNDKSASDELERSLISKLKLRCGQQFTTKLDGMITDISLATDLKKNYDSFKKDDAESADIADISVTVLTTGFWPSYKQCDLTIPPELIGCLESFTRFYADYKKHTKLTWLHTLGHAMLVRAHAHHHRSPQTAHTNRTCTTAHTGTEGRELSGLRLGYMGWVLLGI